MGAIFLGLFFYILFEIIEFKKLELSFVLSAILFVGGIWDIKREKGKIEKHIKKEKDNLITFL